MEWEAWCAAYPVREATLDDLGPKWTLAEGPFDDRRAAESRMEWLEVTHERGGFEVVTFMGQFFVLG